VTGGEAAAAYEDLFAGIHAAVKPVDTIDEMLIADVVLEEWEVLRCRRLKFSLIRVHQLEVLEQFLRKKLDYDLYAEDFTEDLAEILEDNLPKDQADAAQQLANACARNDSVAVDKVNEALARIQLDMSDILYRAQVRKAKELAQKYVRREPDAVTLVDEIVADASVSIDDLMTKALAQRLDNIERIDRLISIAESRRNTSLREIDRRRAVLGETLRRSVKEVEDAEFQVVGSTPTRGKSAA
jgi:hypothetical protein